MAVLKTQHERQLIAPAVNERTTSPPSWLKRRRRFSIAACQSMLIIRSKIVHVHKKVRYRYFSRSIMYQVYVSYRYYLPCSVPAHNFLSARQQNYSKQKRTMIFALTGPCYTLLTLSFTACSAFLIGQAQASVSEHVCVCVCVRVCVSVCQVL